MRKLPTSYPMFDLPYGSEIPTEQYYVVLYDAVPSKYVDTSLHYDEKITEYFKSLGFELNVKLFSNNRRHDQQSTFLLIENEKQIFVRVIENTNKKDTLVQLEFMYQIKNGELETQIDFTKIKEFERRKKKSNISLVKSEMGHLDLEDYDLFVPPMDLELNYGTSFTKIHDVIVDKLNQPNGKGIILLHGDPGTGKTSYIKYLTSLVKEKDILFIPPSMAEMLSEPSIIPFLMDHKNSILIIEDAERVIADREGNGSPAGVSNILNLTDGILGDCLSIQIVATFNMKREKIDSALLRKGRLIAEHKFENLPIDETNKLLKYLNKEHTATESMSLADIYNIDVEVFKTTNKNKIGLF
jgi:hypothetical protein